MFTSIASSPPSPSEERYRWAERVQNALSGAGVHMVFQPIVDMQSGEIVGYEALSRFDNPNGPSLSPDKWFAAAYELGAGAKLESVCLAKALAHRADVPDGKFLSLNIDPDALKSECVGQVLMKEPDLHGVMLEITEHQPWSWGALSGIVAELRSHGARFAVDNTGSGYAGIQQLLDLRPELLKLDRGFVEYVDQDEARAAMVEMIRVFSRRIGAETLAEGVERPEEAHALIDLGVDLAQGYFFGRPGSIRPGDTDSGLSGAASVPAAASLPTQ